MGIDRASQFKGLNSKRLTEKLAFTGMMLIVPNTVGRLRSYAFRLEYMIQKLMFLAHDINRTNDSEEELCQQYSFFLETSSFPDEIDHLVKQCRALAIDPSTIVSYSSITPELDSLLCSFVALLHSINDFTVQFCQLASSTSPSKSLTDLLASTLFPPHVINDLALIFLSHFAFQLQVSDLLCSSKNNLAAFCHQLESRQEEFEAVYSNHPSTRLASTITNEASFIISLLYGKSIQPFVKQALVYRIGLAANNWQDDEQSSRLLKSLLGYRSECLANVWLPRILPRHLLASCHLDDQLIYQSYYDARQPELFSLAIDYPDSIDSLHDLAECLRQLQNRQSFIDSLARDIKHRLLHPGVHTEQLLTAYTYLVRALRVIDQSLFLQQVVCHPISMFLKQRDDAARCIVEMLILALDLQQQKEERRRQANGQPIPDADDDDGPSTELYLELLVPRPLEVEASSDTMADDPDADVVAEDPDFDLEESDKSAINSAPGRAGRYWTSHHTNSSSYANWQPEPAEAIYASSGGGSDKLTRSGRRGGARRLDLLSTLLSLYGSKKAFMAEYKQLLGQRLLFGNKPSELSSSPNPQQTDNELRIVELLKLRFGDEHLLDCEVMLKDIHDSRRLLTLIKEANKTSWTNVTNHQDDGSFIPLSTFNFYTLSAFYWPNFKDLGSFKLPPKLQGQFDTVKKSFERLKGNQSLRWVHDIGLVSIELELGNRKIQLEVKPLQAALVHLFAQRRVWSLRQLSQLLDVPVASIRRSLQLFVNHNLLRPQFDGDHPQQQDSSCLASYEVCEPADNSILLSPTQRLIQGSSMLVDEPESPSTATTTQGEQELEVYWTYIQAMLTNLGSLSLDRIHSLLAVFAASGSSITADQAVSRDVLRLFLDVKIKNSLLRFDGDLYELN